MIKWINTDQSLLVNTDYIITIEIIKQDGTYVVIGALSNGKVLPMFKCDSQSDAEKQLDFWMNNDSSR